MAQQNPGFHTPCTVSQQRLQWILSSLRSVYKCTLSVVPPLVRRTAAMMDKKRLLGLLALSPSCSLARRKFTQLLSFRGVLERPFASDYQLHELLVVVPLGEAVTWHMGSWNPANTAIGVTIQEALP